MFIVGKELKMSEIRKRILLLSALLVVVACGAIAQTQTGYVKTADA